MEMRNLWTVLAISIVVIAALTLATAWGLGNRVKKDDVPELVAPLVKAEAVKQVAAALKAPEARKIFLPTPAELKAIVTTAIAADPTVKSLVARKGGLDEAAVIAIVKKTVTTDPKIAAYIASKTGTTEVAAIDEGKLRALVLNIIFTDPDASALWQRQEIDEEDLFLRMKQELLEDGEFISILMSCCDEPAPTPVIVPPVVVAPAPKPAPVVITPAPTPPAPKKPVKAIRAGSWTLTQTVSIVNQGDGTINFYRGADATK